MKKMMTIAGLSLLPIASAMAENKAATKAAAPPRIDIATPESALKTYWNYLDWRENLLAPKEAPLDATRKMRDELLANKRLEDEKNLELDRIPMQMRRTILKTNQVSAERVEIDAKITNLTPLSEEFSEEKLLRELSGRQKFIPVLEQRKKGDEFKYTLIKDKAGWKVADVQIKIDTMGVQVMQPAFSFEAIPYSRYRLLP